MSVRVPPISRHPFRCREALQVLVLAMCVPGTRPPQGHRTQLYLFWNGRSLWRNCPCLPASPAGVVSRASKHSKAPESPDPKVAHFQNLQDVEAPPPDHLAPRATLPTCPESVWHDSYTEFRKSRVTRGEASNLEARIGLRSPQPAVVRSSRHLEARTFPLGMLRHFLIAEPMIKRIK